MQVNNPNEPQFNLKICLFWFFCLIPWLILFFNKQILTKAISYDYLTFFNSNLVGPISKKICTNICSMCNTEVWQEEWEEHQKIEAWNQKKQMRNAWEKRQNELVNEWTNHLNHLDDEWDQHLKKMENEWNKRRKQFHKRREIKIDEAEMGKDPLGLSN